MSQITYNFYDNQKPELVLPQIKRLVSLRAQHPACRWFYIGQTNNPERRFTEHQCKMTKNDWKKWTHMEVLYGHRSLGFVTNVEDQLITHGLTINHPVYKDNFFNRKISSSTPPESFSVYVLLDENRAVQDKQKIVLDKYNNIKARNTRSAKHREKLLKAQFDQAICATKSKKPAQYVYVGITSNPQRRFKEHQSLVEEKYNGGKWDTICVLYQTTSLNRALETESILFKHAVTVCGFNNVMTANVRNLHDGRLPYSYVYLLEEHACKK